MARINYNRVKIANQLRNSEPVDTERSFRFGYWPTGASPYKRQPRPELLERIRKAKRAEHVAAILSLRKSKQA